MMKKTNKKAQLGHATTWLHKFFILVLVIGGIIAIVTMHYSKQYDVRDVEASVVARNIVECVAPGGILKEFNEETIRNCFPFNEEEIYMNITLENDNLVFGNDFLATLCKAEGKKVKVEYYPACLEERYYVLENDEGKTLNLFIAIKKIGKNL